MLLDVVLDFLADLTIAIFLHGIERTELIDGTATTDERALKRELLGTAWADAMMDFFPFL
jgi:hypothetical protein